jgi:hypothetical protein
MQTTNFLCLKMRYLDRDKTQKKLFFEFFSSISWGFSTGTKGEKVVLFAFNTGSIGEL